MNLYLVKYNEWRPGDLDAMAIIAENEQRAGELFNSSGYDNNYTVTLIAQVDDDTDEQVVLGAHYCC